MNLEKQYWIHHIRIIWIIKRKSMRILVLTKYQQMFISTLFPWMESISWLTEQLGNKQLFISFWNLHAIFARVHSKFIVHLNQCSLYLFHIHSKSDEKVYCLDLFIRKYFFIKVWKEKHEKWICFKSKYFSVAWKKRKNKRNDDLVFMQGILNRQNLIGWKVYGQQK